MTVEKFMLVLLIMSTFTTLITEGWKKTLGDNAKYASNVLAAIVSVAVAICGSCGYLIYTSTHLTPQNLMIIILLTICTWLCSMLGYDKVKQAILQIKG